MDASLKEKFSRIKLLATDFDGVMTDGLVYVDQDGKETVRCSRKDGMGVELLKKHGVTVGVLSKETNPVVTARCNKLKIPVWQGIATGEGKLEILQRIMKEQISVSLSNPKSQVLGIFISRVRKRSPTETSSKLTRRDCKTEH